MTDPNPQAATQPAKAAASLPWANGELPSLAQLINAFTQARDAADWMRIAQLNDFTQPCVEAEISAVKQAASSRGDDPASAIIALKPQLELLSTLYQAIQQQCSQERDQLATQLGTVSTGRMGARQYNATSSL